MNDRSATATSGTRARLLDTAERLFANRGFAATSVREITEAAGANLGAVNCYFRSKDNLYAEVFVRRAALLRDPIVAAAHEAAGYARTDPHRAFRALGRAFLAPHEDRAVSLSLMGLFAREAVEPSLPPHLFVHEFFVPTIDAIAGIVQQIRPDLSESSSRDVAHAFFAQLMHIVKGAHIVETPIDERLERAVRFTVAGVLHLDDSGAPTRPAGAPPTTT